MEEGTFHEKHERHEIIEDYIFEDRVSASRRSGYACPEPVEAARRGGQSPPYGKSLNSHELCNYTRGQRSCTTSCSHAVNSCHYGGKTGSEGALAVDFGNQAIGDRIIQAAIACGVPSNKARCENVAGKNVGCASGSGANHVHISAASCDAN